MSDSDDTDLLLLIPPDFFLVHSSELDSLESDCELNFRPDHDELKDFVVNDLITQVNDLESRVCMIENLESSITRSTCNEDSLVNQSVNSLTESDILRVRNQEIYEIYPDETLVYNHSYTSGHETKCDTLGNSFLLEKHLTNLDTNKIDSRPVKFTDQLSSNPNFSNSSSVEQSALLEEIDYFLATKDNINSTAVTISEGCESRELILDRNCSLEAFDRHFMFSSQNNLASGESLDNNSGGLSESLALPEVYGLLREMEETQHEIEKKLMFRDLVLSQTQDNKATSDKIARNNLRKEDSKPNVLNSNAKNIEDIYSRSSKPLTGLPPFNKENQVLSDRVNMNLSQNHEITNIGRHKSDSNTQVSFLYSPVTSILSDDKLMSHNESVKLKGLSPGRVGNGQNHIDAAKVNSPKRSYKGYVSELSDRKDSPQKSTGFRRHLLFEKPFMSSKPRYHLRDEHMLRSSNKFLERDDDSSIADKVVGRMDIKRRPNALLDKSISLPLQTSTEKFLDEQGLATVIDNKNSVESLQQKLR